MDDEMAKGEAVTMINATVTTKKGSLTVRKSPSTSSKKVKSYRKGDTIYITTTKTVKSNKWGKVVTKDGKTIGWVMIKKASVNYYYVDLKGVASKSNNATKPKNNDTKVNPGVNTLNDNNTKPAKNKAQEITYMIESGGYVNYVNTRYYPTEVTREVKTLGEYLPSPISRNAEARALQNSMGFPPVVSTKNARNPVMDYTINYSEISDGLKLLRKSINISNDSIATTFKRYTKKYNRFKIPTPNDTLTKTFSHVFFTRPDCNILRKVSSGSWKLTDTVKDNPVFSVGMAMNEHLLYQLTSTGPYYNDFMMYASNKAGSFEEKDTSIDMDTYGKTFRGHSIAYGKHNVKSKASSEFSVTYNDDRNLHITHLHNYWTEYISGVYTGRFTPDLNKILQKELDYACSAYYIVTAENGEDIIYWAKYYGVFPTNVPTSMLSWSAGQVITNPEVNITYAYSIREPMNPETLYEFNLNSHPGSYKFAKTYEPSLLSTGRTWVGGPFIEFTKDSNGRPLYKLRFYYK